MKNTIHYADQHVGNRLRLRRQVMGYSQEKLAEALGITFQQVQKYESGANRISASRLWDAAKELECTTSYFFEGLDDPSEDAGHVPNQLSNACVKFATHLNKLKPEHRKAVLVMVEALADKGSARHD